jgi:hypothetical protein
VVCPDRLIFVYQCQRCSSSGTGCTDIPGATRVAYKLTAADVGHDVSVVATAIDEESQTGQASTNPLGPVSS